MGRRCSICTHLERQQIDAAVVQNTESYRIIAKKYDISFASLQRHVKAGHITKELREEYRTEGLIESEALAVQIKDLQRLLHAFLRKANDEGELREVLMLSKEIRGLIELLGKLLGRFREPEINILINPVWLSLKAQIFQALAVYPDAQQAVLKAVGEGDLADTQKQMLVADPEHKAITPGVLEIINSEFNSDIEEQNPERLPEIAYEKKRAKKPASVSRIRLLCVKENSYRGKRWSAGQVWDSDKPDGPEPGGENWIIFNPAIHSGLEPTTRR